MVCCIITPIPGCRFTHVPPFVLVAYHGVSKGDRKANTATILNLLAKMHPTYPVIIGGDWNADLLNEDVIHIPSHITVCKYEPIRKFERVIDWICIYKNPLSQHLYTHCNLIKVQAIDVYDESRALNPNYFTKKQYKLLKYVAKENSLEYYKYTLDYDPIMAVLQLKLK
jgi:hypothetical protein